MLNPRMPNHNRDSRQTSAYVIYPIVLAKRSQALSYRLIERIRRYLYRVLDPFKVAAGHCARAKTHTEVT